MVCCKPKENLSDHSRIPSQTEASYLKPGANERNINDQQLRTLLDVTTGRQESQQPTASQIIRICMDIYLKINKTVKIYINRYGSIHTA